MSKLKQPEVNQVTKDIMSSLDKKFYSAADKNSPPISQEAALSVGIFLAPSATGSLTDKAIKLFGEVDDGKFEEAESVEDKNALVLESIIQTTKADKSNMENIIKLNKYDSQSGIGQGLQLIFFANAPGGFANNKKKRMFKVLIPSVIFKTEFPQSRPNQKKAKPSKSGSYTNGPYEITPNKGISPAKQPASDNISFSDSGNFITIIRIGDIGVYTTIANILLKDLTIKLKEYGVTLDKPINMSLQATKIEGLANHIVNVLKQNNKSYSPEDYVKIKFSSSYEFISLHFVKGVSTVQSGVALNEEGEPIPNPSPNAKPSGQASPPLGGGTFFVDSTLNSIIYNLIPMFIKYGERLKQDGFIHDVQNTIFFSEESMRWFLNAYIFPKTSFVTSPVTKSLIEKFIIGDIRMLNDETYRKSFMDPEQIPEGVRANLEREISQGYEKIGDLLGDAWFTGKFEVINDVEEFRKSLLQYIDVKELISVAVQCLLYLVPLDEWLDEICEPILKEFDKHKEAIIQELDKMEDGVAKDLAKELKEIYFNRVLGPDGALGQLENQVVSGIKKFPERLKDADTILSWRDKNLLQVYVDLTRANQYLVNSAMTDGETPINLFGEYSWSSDWNSNNSIAENTFVYSGLEQREKRTDERIKDLESELNKLQNQLAVFNGVNEPKNLVELRSYYQQEISKQKQKRNSAREGIEIGKELLDLYNILLGAAIPNLITIDPYLDSPTDKKSITLSGVPYLTQKGISEINQTQFLKSIKELNAIRYPTLKNNEQIFKFSEAKGADNTYIPSKTVFDSQVQTGLKLIVDRIQELQDKEEAPFNILEDLADFGTGVLDQTLDAILGDDTKRRKLCLAIIAAIPAAGYALYLVTRNGGEAWDMISKEALAITDAIEKKVEIFAKVDYPYVDILEEFVDSLKQIGINFARDLIITGIKAALKELKKACADEEKTNAPYSPIGAVDLSDFMSTSKKGPNGEPTGDTKNSLSYKMFSFKDGSLTKEKFDKILSSLSGAFTINEMSSLLNGSASDYIYQKAIDVLEGLVPDVLSKDGSFYTYYVNEAGIIEFFEIISQDIEPAMIARARRDFRLGKQKLLEMCAGNDFSLLGDLDDEAIRQALADNYADRVASIPDMVRNVSKLFGENKVPEPCEVGISTLTDSQKFTARQASETIYTGLESMFNSTAVSTKETFLNRFKTVNNYSKLKSSATAQSFFDFTQQNKGDIIKLGNKAKSQFVAEPTRNAVKGLVGRDSFSFKYDIETDQNYYGSKKIVLSLDGGDFQLAAQDANSAEANELIVGNFKPYKIDFEFNYGENALSLEYQYGQGEVTQGDDPTDPNRSVGYKVFNYLTSSNGDLLEPKEVLFDNDANDNSSTKGVILQPDYDEIIKLSLSDVISSNGDHWYLVLLNSILKDLAVHSLNTGLYKKENFVKLDLNKHITPVKLNLGDGKSPIDACFLGFANKEVLHRQTEYIAKLLACRNNSATKTPFNMGYVKILFDCFIRSIVLEEMMKSFFVLGLFPQDLVFDNITPNNISLYEQVIKANVAQRLSSFTPVNLGTGDFEQVGDKPFFYDTFYNNVFKSFVVDMARVIFKNNELGEQVAYDFTINSQIQFVKNQFRKAFQNAFGGSESIIGITEYQLLSQQIIDQSAEVFDINPMEKSDELSYGEKIRAIQNDTLSDFYSSTRELQVVDGDIILGSSKNYFGNASIPNNTPPETDDGFDVISAPDVLLFDKRIPLFQRLAPGQSPTTAENPSPSGLVMDTFIELKPKTTAFTAEQRAFIELRLKYIGRMFVSPHLSIALGSGSNTAKVTKIIKDIFSYTGFYMLIPQAIPFITSDNLRYKYVASPAGWGDKNIIDDAEYNYNEFGLFYWMFRYNYDPDFSKDPKAVKWYNEMVESGLWSDLDHSLTGKIKLGDFYKLLDMMVHTLHSDYAKAELHNINEKLKNGAQHWSEFYWVINSLITGQNADYFNLFYSRKMIDLFHANTVLRIDAKLAENKDIFALTKKFSQKLFFGFGNEDVASKTDIPIQKTLLEEKIGPELLGEAGNVSEYVFSAPMFELKQPFPDHLTLQNFVLNIDEYGYFQDDNFYNIFNINEDTTSAEVAEKISSASTINDFLFNVGERKGNAYSYFYRLKSFSNPSHTQVQTVKNKTYLSTFWWNIKGRPVMLKDILKAVYLNNPTGDTDPDAHFIPVYNQGGGSLSTKLKWKDIRDALTPLSLASFLLPFDEILDKAGPNGILDGKAEAPYQSESFGTLHLSYISKDLREYEKIALVDNTIKELLSGLDASESEYSISYDKEKGTFKEGYKPFIAIRDYIINENGQRVPIDWGFFNWEHAWQVGASTDLQAEDEYKGVASELSSKYIGSDFQSQYVYAKSPVLAHAPICVTGYMPKFAEPTHNDAAHPYWISCYSNYDDKILNIGLHRLGPQYDPQTMQWENTIDRGTYVKGGLGYAEEEVVEKPTPGNIINMYDLFGKMLKSNEDKKVFSDLLNSFFLKEQTTIVALVNRILTDIQHPKLSSGYQVLSSECYKQLATAVAVANGDYEVSTKKEDPGPSDAEKLAKVGQILGEALLKAIASTVDPTWQTPWFAPGPLTPFGFAAKLLGEDFSTGGGGSKTKFPPGELVCNDSLRESVDFLDNFAADWEGVLTLPSKEPTDEDSNQ